MMPPASHCSKNCEQTRQAMLEDVHPGPPLAVTIISAKIDSDKIIRTVITTVTARAMFGATMWRKCESAVHLRGFDLI